MSEELEPEFDEYDDFYELLGVTKRADEEEIKEIGRDLMASHHPDINDEDGARELYMKINRASDVLSDPEQRKIYDTLGHDQYIQRREEGGEMELSEDIMEEESAGGITVGGVVDGEGAGVTDVSDQDYGGESGSGYDSIDEVSIEKTPAERVSDLYKRIWGLKTGLFAVLLSSLYYVKIEYASQATTLYESSILAAENTTIELSVLVGVVGVMVLVSVTGGIYSQRTLRGDREELHAKRKKAREKERQRESEKSSSGLNTSTKSRTSETWDDPELDLTDITDSSTSNDYTGTRPNNSLTAGGWGVFAILFFTLVSSVSPGSNIWVFTTSILSGGGTPIPWLPMSDSLAEMEVLMNMAGMGVLIFLLVISLPLVIHGLAKKRWYNYFYKDEAKRVWVFEGVLSGVAAMTVTSVLFGSEVLYYTTAFSGGVLTDLLSIYQGYTNITFSLVGLLIIFILYLRE